MNKIFFSVTWLHRKNFARDVTQFISLLESDDRAKGNQFLEATMQMEEFNCKEQRFHQGSWDLKEGFKFLGCVEMQRDIALEKLLAL